MPSIPAGEALAEPLRIGESGADEFAECLIQSLNQAGSFGFMFSHAANIANIEMLNFRLHVERGKIVLIFVG